MEILNVKIEGFKNIKSVCIEFSKITAIVALNGYGKSNILDAIDFGIDFIKANNEHKESMMGLSYAIPMLKGIASMNYTFNIELKIIANDDTPYCIYYGFTFSWIKDDESGAKIISEWLKIKQDSKGQKYNSFISRDNKIALYKSSETGRCSKNIKIEDNSLIINKLLAYDNLFYLDIIKQINNIQFYVERHLDANTSYGLTPYIKKSFKELDIDNMNSIPKTIYFLKKEYENKYNLLIDAFIQLFPDIEKISVEEIPLGQSHSIKIDDLTPITLDKFYVMFVEDKKLTNTIAFDRLSDGAKRIFLLLTYAIVADIKGLPLIAIEEPENSIHPGLLQSYLNILSQLVSDGKIIFSSHSPYIIQYINPHDIYIGISQENGIVNLHRIASSKAKSLIHDAWDSEVSTGDYIFNMMSKPDELNSLNEYLEN